MWLSPFKFGFHKSLELNITCFWLNFNWLRPFFQTSSILIVSLGSLFLTPIIFLFNSSAVSLIYTLYRFDSLFIFLQSLLSHPHGLHLLCLLVCILLDYRFLLLFQRNIKFVNSLNRWIFHNIRLLLSWIN